MENNRISIHFEDEKFYVFKLCDDGIMKPADRHDLKTLFDRPVVVEQATVYFPKYPSP